MTSSLIIVGMLLLGVAAGVYGALMLVSPRRWRGLMDRASAADLWSSRTGPRGQGMEVQTRVAGVAIGAGGVYFVVTALRALAKSKFPWRAVKVFSQATVPATRSWFNITAPLAVVVFGVYLLLFPDSLLRWGARKIEPPREIEPRAMPYLRVIIRVMGVIAVVGGATGAYGWMRAGR